METIKDYHKNSKQNKKGKTKSKHQESPTRTKVHEPSISSSSLFPFLNKLKTSEKFKPENECKRVFFSCPQKSCKCSFAVSASDLENNIILCPNGHNICAEVIFLFF